MHCPFCNAEDTKVIDSRLAAEGAQVRRRRQCTACQERFTTFEIIEAVMPRIIKSNGRIEPYDGQKLRRSVQLPLQKRPISTDNIEAMISRIEKQLRQLGESGERPRRVQNDGGDPAAYCLVGDLSQQHALAGAQAPNHGDEARGLLDLGRVVRVEHDGTSRGARRVADVWAAPIP